MTDSAVKSPVTSGQEQARSVWRYGAVSMVLLGTLAFSTPSAQQQIAALLGKGELVAMKKPATVLAVTTPATLNEHFARIGYQLDAVRNGEASVPRILLARVPEGLADIKETAARKTIFLQVMLPLVIAANERVLRQRAQIIAIDAKLAAGRKLSPDQQRRLEAIAAEYGVDPDRTDLLLLQVDAVPVSLALAQAAIESGWGTSRFVIEGNAPFGQWTFGSDRNGIVPLRREEGKTHKIRAFDQLLDSVDSYIRNLNTHLAYRELREQRYMMRMEGEAVTGPALVPTLHAYSETGGRYLGLLRSVIRENQLTSLDSARFGDERVTAETGT